MKSNRVCITLSAILLTATSTAVFAGSRQPMTATTAKAIVAEYKSLRQQCSAALEDDRKACFNALSQANEEYKAAKKVLGVTQPTEQENVRYVTFVN